MSRYLRNQSLAKLYYNQAREINPLRGHAYNQMAFVSSGEHLLQVYYYVRACSSVEEAISIAEVNLRSTVNRFSATEDVIRVLFERPDLNLQLDVNIVSNWLYVVVIAIYNQNFGAMARPLVISATAWLRNQAGLNPFSSSLFETSLEADEQSLLPSLDLFLAYLLVSQFPSKGRLVRDLEKEFKDLKVEATSLLCQSDNFAIFCDRTALRHDYMLFGFKPLFEVHRQLQFNSAGYDFTGKKNSNEFICLVKKINDKVDRILTLLPSLDPLPHPTTLTRTTRTPPGFRTSPGQVQNAQNSSRSPAPGSSGGVRKSRNLALQSIIGPA